MTEDDALAERIVSKPRTVAVVGLSPKEHRDSFRVAQYMQAQGWRIVPINPNAAEILGQKAYATLEEAAQHIPIHVVNVFRQSAEVPPVIDAAIAIGAKYVWLQLGISHPQALAKARAAGLQVVQDKCLKIEHARRYLSGNP